jgi:hypothetical protein
VGVESFALLSAGLQEQRQFLEFPCDIPVVENLAHRRQAQLLAEQAICLAARLAYTLG